MGQHTKFALHSNAYCQVIIILHIFNDPKTTQQLQNNFSPTKLSVCS